MQTVNPSNEEVIKSYETLNSAQITELIALSNEAFLNFRYTRFIERQQWMINLAQLLKKNIESLSLIIVDEMGKPLTQARNEIDKCVWLCEFYAQHAEDFLKDRLVATEMSKSWVTYQPLGVVLSIMPWNYPFWQVLRCAVPAVMAGNAVVLKHATICTGAGVALTNLFVEAGFPKHLFQHALVDRDAVETIIGNPYVRAVSFTGSEAVGKTVASCAGKHLKKIVLELGGSDPYLVFADADVDEAAECIITSRLSNCGQVCIAAKRIIAHEQIYEQLITTIKHGMARYHAGDPRLPQTNLGPMARKDLRDALQNQIDESVQQGAHIIRGGNIPNGIGYYYPATLLANVKPGMPAFDQELFGPVIAVIKAHDERTMVERANQSDFGLAAALFTKDIKRAEYLAVHEIMAGVCFINTAVVSDPRLPFGGIKHSGFGRELSREGIHEFVNIKTIAIK